MVKKLIALMLAVVIAMTLFLPISNAVSNHSGVEAVGNESLSADPGSYQDVDGYDVDESTLEVEWYNSTSGNYETLTEGTDYEFRYTPGEIKVDTSSDVSEGDELLLTYEYQKTDPTTTTVITLVPLMMGVLVIGIMGRRISEAV